eukprot:g958.t1
MKWSADNDKASLAAMQKALDGVVEQLKALDGFKSVQRVVCGGCLDFKVITCLSADKYGDWEGKVSQSLSSWAIEEEFLATARSTEGITDVETQTYTLETL